MSLEHSLFVQVLSMKDNIYVHLFIIAIILDIITGNARGFLTNEHEKLNSTTGFKGLLKHMVVIIVGLILYPYLLLLQFTSYANTIIVFYITTYSVSILENLNQMGIKLPIFLLDKIERKTDQRK